MSLRVWLKEGRRYREVENGPFPITVYQLKSARAMFAAELSATKPLHGAHHAPQTTARDILKKAAPELNDFDALMLGFAVTSSKIRWEEAHAGPL